MNRNVPSDRIEQELNVVMRAIRKKAISNDCLRNQIEYLILNVASLNEDYQFLVLWMVWDAVKEFGDEVQLQVNDFLEELKITTTDELNQQMRAEKSKVTHVDRFTKEPIVISMVLKNIAIGDIRMPSLLPLAGGNQSQFYFLTLLRLFKKLHEGVRKAAASRSSVFRGARKPNIYLQRLQMWSEQLAVLRAQAADPQMEKSGQAQSMNVENIGQVVESENAGPSSMAVDMAVDTAVDTAVDMAVDMAVDTADDTEVDSASSSSDTLSLTDTNFSEFPAWLARHLERNKIHTSLDRLNAYVTDAIIELDVLTPPGPWDDRSANSTPERSDPRENATSGAARGTGRYFLRSSVRRAPDVQPEASQSAPTDMDTNPPAPDDEIPELKLPEMSDLFNLDNLWSMLNECLLELERAVDHHALLVLQPVIEAFFLVHSPKKSTGNGNQEVDLADNTLGSGDSIEMPLIGPQAAQANVRQSTAEQKVLEFAEKHRTAINKILRLTHTHLSDGPFAVLLDHTQLLDFDVKRIYFYTELQRLNSSVSQDDATVHIRRSHIFEESFLELYALTPDEWKNRFYIVFDGEDGQDGGGLLREWYMVLSRQFFDPKFKLFTVSEDNGAVYLITPATRFNPNYYKFVGHIIAKAIFDNKLLHCYFQRSFYKHLLGKPVEYTDMESDDPAFYKSICFLITNKIDDLGYEFTFSHELNDGGKIKVWELIPNGANIVVTDENKMEYVRLLCNLKMTGSINGQLDAFTKAFYEIIPKHLISIFNEQELELMVCGLPNIDVDDLRANTEYDGYDEDSLQVQWFWSLMKSFSHAEKAKFLQFVTGTFKAPLLGFAALEGTNGPQKFQIRNDEQTVKHYPTAHTCANQLHLPPYDTFEELKSHLLFAMKDYSEGFSFP